MRRSPACMSQEAQTMMMPAKVCVCEEALRCEQRLRIYIHAARCNKQMRMRAPAIRGEMN